LVASCLSRKTLECVRHTTYDPLPETWSTLELAMHLLAPDHPESIAGWRDLLSAEGLADLLGITQKEAHDRLRGRTTWTESKRTRLVQYLGARSVSRTD
jgi:hypothetical protein